jgi:hypothetical protein
MLEANLSFIQTTKFKLPSLLIVNKASNQCDPRQGSLTEGEISVQLTSLIVKRSFI